MRRGNLYRVRRPGGDPKRSRIFVVVSRQVLLDSAFSTAVCAPVFTEGAGLLTQIAAGIDEGLKHPSWGGRCGRHWTSRGKAEASWL